jgi:hypothetical protein
MFPGSRLVQQTRIRLQEGAAILLSDGFLGHDPDGGGCTFALLDWKFIPNAERN